MAIATPVRQGLQPILSESSAENSPRSLSPSSAEEKEKSMCRTRSKTMGYSGSPTSWLPPDALCGSRRGSLSQKVPVEEPRTPRKWPRLSRKTSFEEPVTPSAPSVYLQQISGEEPPRTPTARTAMPTGCGLCGTPSKRSGCAFGLGGSASEHIMKTPNASMRGAFAFPTVMMTPEMPSHKAQAWTPPPAPNVYHIREEVNNDLSMALSFNSVPLLSLALCRSHNCCGEDPRRRGYSGKTHGDHSMHEAVEIKNLAAVALLLKDGPKELLHEPCCGILPLSRALKNAAQRADQSYLAAEMLLKHGANPDLGSGSNCDTPLHQAAAAGAIHAVSLLLEHGANPNERNSEGFTPLHSLCHASTYLPRVSKEQVVVALLQKGAEPTLTDQSGHLAVDYLHSPAGPYLVMHQPNHVHNEMNNRIRERLLRAAFLYVRLQLVLASGRCENESGFSKLPLPVLETVAHFM